MSDYSDTRIICNLNTQDKNVQRENNIMLELKQQVDNIITNVPEHPASNYDSL